MKSPLIDLVRGDIGFFYFNKLKIIKLKRNAKLMPNYLTPQKMIVKV
jgi:hypothetical protein